MIYFILFVLLMDWVDSTFLKDYNARRKAEQDARDRARRRAQIAQGEV